MQVLFRVDASLEIGSGHVARCKVLADALSRLAAAQCTFIGRDPDGLTEFILEGSPHSFLPVDGLPTSFDIDRTIPHAAWLASSQEEDLEACRRSLGMDWNADWLVVDHYAIDTRWEREFPGKVLAIDDLADRCHAADLLLDQNLRDDPWNDYSGLLSPATRLLAGPRFALLRDEFSEQPEGSPRHDLFVSFGGADSSNNTGRLLAALERLPGTSAQVAVTSRHPFLDELLAAADALPGCELHVDHPRISSLMRDARLAVGAGGGMTWERCACGLPTLAWPSAVNQQDQLRQARDAGAVVLLTESDREDPATLAGHVRQMLDDPPRLEQMATAARALCDGKGAQRVVRAMQATALRLRPAKDVDAEMVWRWRNAPAVRATAFDTSEIPLEQHLQWWVSSLGDGDRVMRIAQWEGLDVGFVRLDRKGNAAEVSIFLAADQQGLGLGPAMLAAVEEEIPSDWNVTALHAGIRPENDISIRLFENAGYARKADYWRKALVPTEESKR